MKMESFAQLQARLPERILNRSQGHAAEE